MIFDSKLTPHSLRAFTLIEVIVAALIFGIVLIVSFSLYKYFIQLGVDSRNVANVKNMQSTAFEGLEGIIRIDGWENFLDKHLDQGEFTLTSNPYNANANTYTYTVQNNNTNSVIYPAPVSQTPQAYRWTFKIESDDALGPYISTIRETGGKYELTFSTNVLSDRPLDQILPSLNNPSHSWDISSYPTSSHILPSGGNPLVITLAGTPTMASGDRVKPSATLTDTTHNSDMTYTRGVALPAAGQTQKGYPQLVRATVTLVLPEESYRATQYIRYLE